MLNAIIKEGKCITCHLKKSYLYRGPTKVRIKLLWVAQWPFCLCLDNTMKWPCFVSLYCILIGTSSDVGIF